MAETKNTEKTVKPKTAPKTTAAKKTAATTKKPATKPAAAKKTSTRKTKAATGSLEERYRMIEVAAYYIAEKDGFAGNPVDYWIAAELQFKE